MLLVVASRFDAAAAELVRRWHRHDARLLTCEGLSQRGWAWYPDSPDRSTAAVGGDVVPITAIRGVLSLLPGVSLAELPHIVPDEREYFASEMMAFLVAFLISLACPVINTPSPLSLVGPRLLHEQWLARAIAAGMTVRPWRRGASAAVGGCQVVAQHPTSESGEHDGSGVRTYSLVGRRCFAEPDTETPSPAIVDQLRRLAAAVGVQVMTAQFVRHDRELCFVAATTTVDVSIPAVADAILEIVDPPS